MPENKSQSNKWLTLSKGVEVSPLADGIIAQLDPIFGRFSMAREVSSGKRDQAKQLKLIIDEAIKQRLVVTFGPGDYAKKEGSLYVWQPIWSKILTYGFMVSPPFDAACLEDYKRPLLDGSHEQIKAGSVRLASGHFYNDFDISGSRGKQAGAQAGSIEDEMQPIREALKQRIITSVMPEKGNNAVHVNLPRTA